MRPESLTSVTKISARIGFLYVERAVVSRKGNALTLTREEGTVEVPLDTFNTLLLAHGVSISHAAIALCAASGVSAVWVGDGGGVWYSSGAPLSRSNNLLVQQAKIVSSESLRIDAARRLYSIRFGSDSHVVSESTVADMQRAEAREMKKLYADMASHHGVVWRGRDTLRVADPVNSAMTLGHSCLYAVCHSVIHALNLSAGLGVVHVGNYRSFTLDIADLYKASVTIPAAFELAAQCEGAAVPARDVRRRARQDMLSGRFLRDVVADILDVLGLPRDARSMTLKDSNDWWTPN